MEPIARNGKPQLGRAVISFRSLERNLCALELGKRILDPHEMLARRHRPIKHHSSP
jgi:hypothetical protein